MKDKLKQARIDAGMTQLQLSKLIGASRAAVSAWERGDRMPGIEYIYMYQKMLGLKKNYFSEMGNIGFIPTRCFDISMLNEKGLKLLFAYYEELSKKNEYLKKPRRIKKSYESV